ncbi:MAG: hypothetical protein KAH10_03665 [Flavobacteriales bacterium]|nr:hypothetical protein [Flavobacteriales bacterium]
MKRYFSYIAIVSLFVSVLSLTSCRDKTPKEKAQDAIENAADATSDAIEDTGDAIDDAAKDTEKAVKKATK